MMCDKKSLLLYAVTDRMWLNGKTLYDQVSEAIKGGVSFVQLREKKLDEKAFTTEALQIQKLCKKHSVPFVINDNVKIAKKINADGVHVGQGDMAAKDVRAMLGKNKILGVSAQTVNQALLAQAQGADYIGVGAVFPTDSKSDADNVDFETLKAICSAVNIPVVAIGGINANNILKLKNSGISGIAVISAIFAAENIESAAKNLKQLTKRVVAND